MIWIDYAGEYRRLLEDLLDDTPELKEIIEYRVSLFQNNFEDTRLENHTLRGKMEGQWAFSITNDVRIVYRWKGKSRVQFLAIGGHEKVYRKG